MVLVYISDKVRRNETEFISAKIISEILDIPKATLSVIFTNLLRAGILESREGIYGGVRLAKKPENISLLDILQAIESEKPLFQTDIRLNIQAKRPDTVKHKVSDILKSVENVMRSELSKTTLEDILNAK